MPVRWVIMDHTGGAYLQSQWVSHISVCKYSHLRLGKLNSASSLLLLFCTCCCVSLLKTVPYIPGGDCWWCVLYSAGIGPCLPWSGSLCFGETSILSFHFIGTTSLNSFIWDLILRLFLFLLSVLVSFAFRIITVHYKEIQCCVNFKENGVGSLFLEIAWPIWRFS